MRTAHEMFKLYKSLRGVKRSSWADNIILNRFKIIEKNEEEEEEVFVTFVGQEALKCPFFYFPWHFLGKLSVFALTNKGIVIVNKIGLIFPRIQIKTVKTEFLNDISKEDRIFFSTINIDTFKETINVTMRKEDAKGIFVLFRDSLSDNELEQQNKINNIIKLGIYEKKPKSRIEQNVVNQIAKKEEKKEDIEVKNIKTDIETKNTGKEKEDIFKEEKDIEKAKEIDKMIIEEIDEIEGIKKIYKKDEADKAEYKKKEVVLNEEIDDIDFIPQKEDEDNIDNL